MGRGNSSKDVFYGDFRRTAIATDPDHLYELIYDFPDYETAELAIYGLGDLLQTIDRSGIEFESTVIGGQGSKVVIAVQLEPSADPEIVLGGLEGVLDNWADSTGGTAV